MLAARPRGAALTQTPRLVHRAQVERVLVATNRALYRCAFSYKEGTLGEARRTEWSTYAQVHVGPFKYQARNGRPRVCGDCALAAAA